MWKVHRRSGASSSSSSGGGGGGAAEADVDNVEEVGRRYGVTGDSSQLERVDAEVRRRMGGGSNRGGGGGN